MHPKTRTQLRAGFRQLASGLALALCSAALTANGQQNASAPAGSQESASEDVVVLSPFEVSTEQDYGYRASNSIAGTRTNTPIKDVPLNIQVFTKDFVDDLGIINQVDMEAYNAAMYNGGSDRHSDNPIQQDYNHFLFRGFRQNWGLRDGIREYDPVDAQGLARVEVVKGPAAALYGLTYPGGVMQNITKSVDWNDNFTSLRFSVDNEGGYRGTVDANVTGELGDHRIGARFNGAHTRTEDRRAHSEGRIEYMQLNLAWQPLRSTTFELLIEDGYREKPNGLGTQSNGNDGRAYFARNEFSDPGGGETGSFGLIPLQISNPDISWDWNWSDGKNMRSLDTRLYRGMVTHAFSEDFQVRGYWQYSARWAEDAHGWGANGDGGAASWEAVGSGWIPSDSTSGGVPVYRQETAGGPFVVVNNGVGGIIRTNYSYRDWTNKMHSYGATAVYKFDVAETHNTFAFGANAWGERFISRSQTTANPHPAGTPEFDAYELANPHQFLDFPVQEGIEIETPFAPPERLHNVTNGNGWTHENSSNDFYFANWQMSAFEDRLTTNLGINHTRFKLLQWANGQATVPNETIDSQTSPLIGAVYDITDRISIFAVHATSLFPDTGKDSFGNQFDPIEGESIEGGFKFDTGDNKLSGTLSFYQITQTGGTQNNPNKVNAQGLLGDLDAGGEQESKGVELDLVYSPITNWQILLSYAHVDQEITESAQPETIGQSTPQLVKDRYAVLTRYTFSEGGLKGLYVGLGVTGGSKVLIDYKPDSAGVLTPRYEPGRTVVDFFSGYRFRVMEQDALVQLNVSNLTGEDDYTGWVATGDPNILATQRYKVPTSPRVRLTFGLDF